MAIHAGNVSRTSLAERGHPTLIRYVPTGTASTAAPSVALRLVAPAPDGERGNVVFGRNCAVCHGAHGEGAAGLTLVGIRQKLDFAATIHWIKNPSAKMPRPFPPTLNEQDVRDVATHVRQF